MASVTEVPRGRAKGVGKAMSWVLRHGAPEVGVPMRSDAFVKLSDLLGCPNMRKLHASKEEVLWIVENNDKKRYDVITEGGSMYIRACQGHSIENINADELLSTISKPEDLPMCCHGTYRGGWKFIKETGLSRMTRTHIHFVDSFDSHAESGAISGLRASAQLHIFIDVPLAMAHGIKFQRASNGVVLCTGDPAAPEEHLHPAFFTDVVDAKTKSTVEGWTRPPLPAWHAPTPAAPAAAAAGGATAPAPPAPTIPTVDDMVPVWSGYVTEAPMPVAATDSGCLFDFLIVVDFEATCDSRDSGAPPPTPQEIIEMPCVVVNTRNRGLVSEFQAYVRPAENPVLTPFCTELTGITQSMVEGQSAFPAAWEAWVAWLTAQGLTEVGTHGPTAAIVTCGDWDLRKCLPKQAKAVSPPVPLYTGAAGHLFADWVNIKTVYEGVYGEKARGMMGMLEGLGIPHVGRHHSGIDDCRNIAAIVLRMLEDGHGAALDTTTAAPDLAKARKRAAKSGGR